MDCHLEPGQSVKYSRHIAYANVINFKYVFLCLCAYVSLCAHVCRSPRKSEGTGCPGTDADARNEPESALRAACALSGDRRRPLCWFL